MDQNLNQISTVELLGELNNFSLKLQKAMNLMEAAEYTYTCITKNAPADLVLIHQQPKGQEANLIFIRTLNDSTISGALMKKEREISNRLLTNNSKHQKGILRISPPLYYSTVVCTIGSISCSLSLMRTSHEFTIQEQEYSAIVVQMFISTQLKKMVEDKTRKIGTQELQTVHQNNFISTITHDLRNPLGVIKGYSSTLLREDIEWDAETRKKFISVIDNEADRLGDMITNMLETARLESGQYELNFDQIAVSTLLNTLIECNKDKHPSLQIILDLPPQDALIMVDSTKIIRAFQNLVDNTIKHTNTLQIWIKIILNVNTIHFYFIDKGEGIPSSRWKSVFNKFSRIANDSPGTHGSGLGLYIAKQIILKHGGEINIDEATDEGTKIRISLPKIPSNFVAA